MLIKRKCFAAFKTFSFFMGKESGSFLIKSDFFEKKVFTFAILNYK